MLSFKIFASQWNLKAYFGLDPYSNGEIIYEGANIFYSNTCRRKFVF